MSPGKASPQCLGLMLTRLDRSLRFTLCFKSHSTASLLVATYRRALKLDALSPDRYSSAPAFRIPQLKAREQATDPLASDEVGHWLSISFLQFHADVERSAKYWSRTLQHYNFPRKTVIGLWIGGMTYADVILIYGLSRAGYVPQLFSLRLPNPVVVHELLVKANAKALIHDPCYEAVLQNSPLPLFSLAKHSDFSADDSERLDTLAPVSNPDDVVFIFHTSGSTSGSPKLVPCNYRWLDTIISKADQVGRPDNQERQDVSVWMGSMCHIAQTFMLLSALQHGSCVVQPTKLAFSSDELVDMIHRCGLNQLNQFPTFLATHLRNARLNPKLLSLLQQLDGILYAGLPLPQEEEDWAFKNGLKVKNLFGSTECGAMLVSSPGDRQLKPLEGVSYGFFPIEPPSPISPLAPESGHQSVNNQMVELVILSNSGDCPDRSLRQADGHFHTGDLFLEVNPGSYIFRGRDDDWIKSENSLRCDTKAIEDNVRSTCADLVADCIVVGNRRPSPVLFIEPMNDAADREKLKKEIIRRTRHFHARRYEHEKLSGVKSIFVVDRMTLPRTAAKGNIRRRAVEDTYEAEIDAVFGPR